MTNDRTLEIVLGEAEPDAGILRMILEAEGFHIVGHASNDDELQRVLAWVQPSVIVLDGGISASAALGARERAASAALVVVWPAGVAAVVAEERVAPERVFDDLGNAVRRASHHVVPRPLVRAQPAPARVRRAATVSAADRGARPVSARRLSLITATTWILFLVALTTIAVAVPAALVRSERPAITEPRTHPHRSPIADRPSPTPHAQPGGTPTTPDPCRAVHAERAHGKGAGAVTSCGRGRPGEGRGNGHANGHDRSSMSSGGDPHGNAKGQTKQPRSGRGAQPTPPVEPGRRVGHARSTT